jgi:tetratricopeptide (TPR) repeat protein
MQSSTKNTRRTLLICALLGAVTLAMYWPVFHHDFVKYDDPDYVTENPHVLRGLTWANVSWAFRTGLAGSWHPLTWLSHLVDVQLFGLNAGWHHLTNLLFHAANAVLLFLVLQRMTGTAWRSAVVAALFALHPLHVESVAWVAERKDVLSAFFFILTLGAYVRYAEKVSSVECRVTEREPGTRKRGVYYALALVFFALGLMSKPMLVTLPFVLLLLDYWPLRRLELSTLNSRLSTLRRLVLEKLPFLALSLTVSILTLVFQQKAGAMNSLEASPLEFRISNALISYVRYAAKMLWPAKLAVFYPAPAQWPVEWVMGAAVLLAGLTVGSVWLAQRAPYIPFGWFWYLGTLVPVVGLIQVGQQAMADRYSYIPLIGLFVAVVWMVSEIPTRRPAFKNWVEALAAAAVMACAVLTWRQVSYWKNNTSLFRHALEATCDNAVAQNNLGVGLLTAGNVTEAEPHFAEAVRIHRNYLEALVNLALCRDQQGHLGEAADLYERALSIRSSVSAHYNLANLRAKQDKPVEAEAHFRAALELNPEFVGAWYNLGILKAKQGQSEQAAQCYAQALKLKPNYTEVHLTLGALLAGQHKFDEAIAQFKAALSTSPTNSDAHFNLAAAWEAKGDPGAAAAEYAEACRLRPEDLEAREKLGLALLGQGRATEALPHLEQVARARPSAPAHYHLALALDGLREGAAAAAHYREAVRLDPNATAYLNDLAWLLATDPRAEVRNGAEAVRLAEEACRLSGGKEARFWGTLDAAYAEAGRFDDAVATATKARDLALAAGNSEIAQLAEGRLALYRTRKPYRSPAPSTTQP